MIKWLDLSSLAAKKGNKVFTSLGVYVLSIESAKFYGL